MKVDLLNLDAVAENQHELVQRKLRGRQLIGVQRVPAKDRRSDAYYILLGVSPATAKSHAPVRKKK